MREYAFKKTNRLYYIRIKMYIRCRTNATSKKKIIKMIYYYYVEITCAEIILLLYKQYVFYNNQYDK